MSNQNSNQESSYERQTVTHTSINPYDPLLGSDLPQTGWSFEVKLERITKSINPAMVIDPSRAFPGYISRYELHFYEYNTERIYKVRIYFDILLDGGLFQTCADLSANLTSGSELTNFLVNMGIPVGLKEKIQLDDLIGINAYCYLGIDSKTQFYQVMQAVKR